MLNMGFDRSFICTFVLLVLLEWEVTRPFKFVGFYCNDPKLMYEYQGETVPSKALFFISLAIPYFIFLVIEYGGKECDKNRIPRIGFWYLKYLRGLCITFLITDVLKLVVGEPRPHFFDTCRPQEAVNCSTGQYFSTYTCSRTLNEKQLTDSYKSFPSGHASFSFYTFCFLMLYLCRASRIKSRYWTSTFQILCLLWATLCSLTRITDCRHHWWDVVAGVALGTLVAIYSCQHYDLTNT